jgi:hypothetical protein
VINSVAIYCDAESHHGKIAEIAEFHRDGNGWDACVRTPTDPHRLSAVRGASRYVRPDDAARLSRKTPLGTPISIPSAALTFTLTCPLCSLNVTCRHDRIAPVLEQLAGAGVSRLSLAAMSRTVH